MTFSKLGTDTDTGQLVYLPKSARTQGLYIIGIQGTGKSALIENLIMEDINQQIGVCVLDPHGELIDHVIARLPGKAEEEKMIFLDIGNYTYPFGLNLFECPDPTDDGEIVKTLYQVLHVFEKAYGIVPTTPLMYDLLYHTVYTLIANPGYTMIDIRLLLTNAVCRKKLAANMPNTDIRDFWRIWDDPKQTTPNEQEQKRGTILNKMNDFLHVPLRNIVGQSNTKINLQDIMDTGKILLVKLSKQLEQQSNLIGSIIIAQLLNAAYARPTNKRRQFHLYADEFQNFATEDFATLFEEARKFGIGTTIAHQNRGQLNSANSKLETDLKDRSRSVANLVVFKVNSKDADDLAGEYDTTPPPAETRQERRQSPVHEVVQFLLHHGSHPDERVNKFVTNYLQPFNRDQRVEPEEQSFVTGFGRDGERHYGTTRIETKTILRWFVGDESNKDEYTYHPDEVRDGLFALNNLMYQTMLDKDLPALIAERKIREVAGYFAHYLGYPNYYQYYKTHQEEETKWREKILEKVKKVEVKNSEWVAASERYKIAREEYSKVQEALIAKYNGVFGDMSEEDNALLERLYIEMEAVHQEKETLFEETSPSKWYTPTNLEPKLHRERDRFEYFTNALLAALAALAEEKNQILDYSGQMQEVPGVQLTSAEVEARISTLLVNLPMSRFEKFARVKIAENIPQNPGKKCVSCGVLNNSGLLVCGQCGTKIIGANEYTIKTIKPPDINAQQLEHRIKRIQANNIRDKYLRERDKVEAEVIERQIGCSSGSSPAQPQKPQPQQPRHARQVPVKGNCPNCGAANAPGSKFCNQCGTKLT